MEKRSLPYVGAAMALLALPAAMGLLLGCAGSRAAAQCPEPQTSTPAADAATDGILSSGATPLDYTKPLENVAGIDEAVDKVKLALTGNGFGVVSDMDFQAVMKEKRNVEMPPYRILGACNPDLAHQAVTKNIIAGLLLPCKVVVYQNPDGGFMVSFSRPTTTFGLLEDAELTSIADDVDGLVRAAFDAL